MPENARIALAGSRGLLAKTLLEMLGDSELADSPLTIIDARDVEDDAGVLYRGRALPVQVPSAGVFEGVALAIFCDPVLAERWIDSAVTAGARVLDASGYSAAQGMGLLVSAGIADNPFADAGDETLFAVPSPAAAVLAETLTPLHAVYGLTRVHCTLLQAVSAEGEAGVNELASQAARMLNGQPVKARTYPSQIAFNSLPETAAGASEVALRDELPRLLGAEAPQLSVLCATVPVFYGFNFALYLEFAQPPGVHEAEQCLRACPGLHLLGVDEPLSAVALAGDDRIHIAPLRQNPGVAGELSTWVVADNLRKGAVVNIISLAKILIKSLI